MGSAVALAFVAVGRLLAAIGTTPPSSDPCSAVAYRAYDFWVGSWTVLAESKPVAESRIERLGAGCALLESYRQADGYRGKSFNYLDPADGLWHQVWMDYADEAVLLPPGALPVAGLDAIRPRYERLFADFVPAIEPRIDRACAAEDVAFVEGHNGGRLRRRDGGPERALDDTFLMVLRRDASSRWRISHLAWW